MAKASPVSRLLLSTFGLLWVLSLALSSLSSKAMGMAWLLMVLAGLWAGAWTWRSGHPLHAPAWVRMWLGVCTVVLILKSVPMLYWSDPWAERHGELRLILGALGIYALVGSDLKMRTRFLPQVAYALSLSSGMGLLWVSVYDRDAVTTHPIPWAGGMAMVSAWLLAMGLKSNYGPKARRIWLIGGLFAVLAVLASRSRGAFGIVVWWVWVCGHHWWCHRSHASDLPLWQDLARKYRSVMAAVVVLIAVGWALSYTPVLQRPFTAVQEAVTQLEVSSASASAGANSSVGSRIFMWQQSWKAIQDSPWIGYGGDGRKQLLSQWADDAHSKEIRRLGHVHNEYLNQLIDHGLWGLGSQLCLVLGLAWVCWTLVRAQETTSALALSGVAFVHFTASFSNVNFAHNYYTASLSTLIGLCLWIAKPKVRN